MLILATVHLFNYIIFTKWRFPLPSVDSSEVDKKKAGTEIFPTSADGKKPVTISIPEEKYVFR